MNRVLQNLDLSGTPLALIPLGTMNLVARECRYPRDSGGLIRLIDACHWRPIYTVMAGDQAFAICAGCGVDSTLMASVDRAVKQQWGRFYLVWKMIVTLFRYRWPELDVRVDGRPVGATAICVIKGRYYGGPFTLTRRARLFDPSLYVATSGRQPLRRALGIATVVLGVPWLSERLFSVAPAREVEILGPPAFPFHVDGDVRLRLPVRVTLGHRPFRMCIPPDLPCSRRAAGARPS